jgi:hypothetical protein
MGIPPTSKPYFEMTASERLADRIARNREIDRRVEDNKVSNKKSSEVTSRQKTVRSVLDEFQQIKRTHGIDAASDFVRDRRK